VATQHDADVVVVAVAALQISSALESSPASRKAHHRCLQHLHRPAERLSFPVAPDPVDHRWPTAKAFSTNFATAYDRIKEQQTAPSNLYAADDDARRYAERLSVDAGYEPVFVGPLDPGARLLEDSSGLTRALAAQLGPFFYRYARPGQL
jgi:hypothetical protein